VYKGFENKVENFFFELFNSNCLLTINVIHLEIFIFIFYNNLGYPCVLATTISSNQNEDMKGNCVELNIILDDNHNQNDNIIITWDYERAHVMYFSS